MCSYYSKKDYEAVAEIIHDSRVSEAAKADLATRFIWLFANDNAAFDSGRFRRAVESGELYRASGRPVRWTKRTFVEFAEILRAWQSYWRTNIDSQLYDDTVESFAGAAAASNPNFDQGRFYRAASLASPSPWPTTRRRAPEVRVRSYTKKTGR